MLEPGNTAWCLFIESRFPSSSKLCSHNDHLYTLSSKYWEDAVNNGTVAICADVMKRARL